MADRPLNVLFVSHRANLQGGGQRSLLTLVEYLDRRLIQPTVMVPDEAGTLPEALAKANIPVIVGHYRTWLGQRSKLNALRAGKHLFTNLSGIWELRSTLHKRQFDLVYSNTLDSPIGAMLALWLRLPHIWHVREFVHEDLEMVYEWGTKFSMAFMNRTSASVICNSRAVMNKMTTSISEKKCTVVYNGFPELADWQSHSRQSQSALKEPVRIGIIGQVREHKGHVDALRALHLLLDYPLRLELWIIGTGDTTYIATLHQLASELGIHDRIVWKGFVEDMSVIWQSLDVLLVCSRAEPFGRVVVEAMAHYCPVIATNSGGIPEIIDENNTGLLYSPGDFQALARQLERLLSDHTLYNQIATAAATTLQRFSVQQYVAEISKIIQQVGAAN